MAVGVLLCGRELLRGVAEATCVLSVLALVAFAVFGFAADGFCAVVAALPALADVLLSIDGFGVLAVADALVSVDFAGVLAVAEALLSVDVGVLALFDALAFKAVLALRQSLNAAPSMPMHGA